MKKIISFLVLLLLTVAGMAQGQRYTIEVSVPALDSNIFIRNQIATVESKMTNYRSARLDSLFIRGAAQYLWNRAADYTARSFTDKGYVDSIASLYLLLTDTSDAFAAYLRKGDFKILSALDLDSSNISDDDLAYYDSASGKLKFKAFPSIYDYTFSDSGLRVINTGSVTIHNGILLWKGAADGLYASLTGSYANPSWITSLAWSKLTGVPSTFTPSTHTHALSDLTQSGATTGQVPQWNGTAWAPATVSGGGGTPGGSSGQVQYNDAGAFAGAANVDIEGGQLRLDNVTTPTAPASGGIKIYSKNIAGNSIPYVKTPDGVETAVQPSLFMGKMPVWVGFASGTTAPVTMGGTIATAATMGTANPASTNEWTKYQRKTYTTSTTAGNQSGLRQSYTQFSSATGGFFAHFKFGQTIALNGEQKFIGMCASTSALAGDASALVHMIGMGIDAADVGGNWYLMHNDGSGVATKIDLGADAARNTTDGYELNIYIGPSSSTYYVMIKNLATGVEVYNGSITTNIPGSPNLLAWKAECRNGAVAAATNLHVATVYIQPL